MLAHLHQTMLRRNVYGSAICRRKQKQKLETNQKTATAEKVMKLQHTLCHEMNTSGTHLWVIGGSVDLDRDGRAMRLSETKESECREGL